MTPDEPAYRPSRRTVAVVAGVASALVVAMLGITLVRRGDGPGAGLPTTPQVSVRTPKPANRSF